MTTPFLFLPVNMFCGLVCKESSVCFLLKKTHRDVFRETSLLRVELYAKPTVNNNKSQTSLNTDKAKCGTQSELSI